MPLGCKAELLGGQDAESKNAGTSESDEFAQPKCSWTEAIHQDDGISGNVPQYNF